MSKAIKQEEFAADPADEYPILESEESFFEETPIFTGEHGDPCFDEYQSAINEIFASCDLRLVPIIEFEVSHAAHSPIEQYSPCV